MLILVVGFPASTYTVFHKVVHLAKVGRMSYIQGWTHALCVSYAWYQYLYVIEPRTFIRRNWQRPYIRITCIWQWGKTQGQIHVMCIMCATRMNNVLCVSKINRSNYVCVTKIRTTRTNIFHARRICILQLISLACIWYLCCVALDMHYPHVRFHKLPECWS